MVLFVKLIQLFLISYHSPNNIFFYCKSLTVVGFGMSGVCRWCWCWWYDWFCLQSISCRHINQARFFTLNWVGRSFRWSKVIFTKMVVSLYLCTVQQSLVSNPTEKWEGIVCSWVFLIRFVYCLWQENKTILFPC